MSQRVRVLVVDDEPSVRTMFGMAVRNDDRFELSGEAADAATALDLAAFSSPHVVVLDLLLPDTDGLEILVRLRDQSPGVRVVVYTAAVGRRSEAIAAGVDAWFTKGQSMRTILDAVHGLVVSDQASAT